MTKRPIFAALAAALSMPLLLTSCTTGIPNDATKETIRAAVVEEVPHATDAIVGLNYDGSPTRPGVSIKVYLDQATPEDVLKAVEKMYFIGWTKFPVEPASVTVAVVDGPMQVNDTFANPMGLDLSDVGHSLKAGDIVSNTLEARPETLERLFGPWKEVSGK